MDDENRSATDRFIFADERLQRQLNDYRRKFEAIHGQNESGVRYLSSLPPSLQQAIYASDPEMYFHGLPLYAQSFIHGKMLLAATDGNLDDMPDQLLRLYVTRKMNSTA